MSDIRTFVSEKQLEEERTKRQEEWERVRNSDQPKDAPDPDYDPRSLFERLKEQRDKKDLEYEETHKLKNLVRGLDSEEVGFLDLVDKMRGDEERKRLAEERALIAEVKKSAEESIVTIDVSEKLAEVGRKTRSMTAQQAGKRPNKQAQLVASAVKIRKTDSTTSEPSTCAKTTAAASHEKITEQQTSSNHATEYPAASVVSGVRISATKCAGILPGINSYSGSSDDSSNSSDSSDDAEDMCVYTNPVQLKIEKAQQQQKEASANAGSAPTNSSCGGN